LIIFGIMFAIQLFTKNKGNNKIETSIG